MEDQQIMADDTDHGKYKDKGAKRHKEDNRDDSDSSIGSKAAGLTISVVRQSGISRPSTTFVDCASVALLTYNAAFAIAAMHPREISSGAYNYFFHFMIIQTLMIAAGAYNELYHTKSHQRPHIHKVFKELIIILFNMKLTHEELAFVESLMETPYDSEGGIVTSTAHILPNTPGFCGVAQNWEKFTDCASYYLTSPSILTDWFVYQARMNTPNGQQPPNMPDNLGNSSFIRSNGPTVMTKLIASANRGIVANHLIYPARQQVQIGPYADFDDSWAHYYSQRAHPGFIELLGEAIAVRNNFQSTKNIFSQHTAGTFFVKGGHSTGRTNGALAMMHRTQEFEPVTGTMNHPNERTFMCEWTAVSPIKLSIDQINISCLFTLNPFYRFANCNGPTRRIGTRPREAKTTGRTRNDDGYKMLTIPDFETVIMNGPMYQLENSGTTAHYHREQLRSIH